MFLEATLEETYRCSTPRRAPSVVSRARPSHDGEDNYRCAPPFNFPWAERVFPRQEKQVLIDGPQETTSRVAASSSDIHHIYYLCTPAVIDG
jgi:hypothetical protein